MHFVMFTLGIISVLAGLLLLLVQEKGEKTSGTAALVVGIALLVLGSDMGQRVQNLKVSGTSVEMSFSPQPAALSDQQVAGAQKAQQARLTQQTPPSNDARIAPPTDSRTGAQIISLARRPDARRIYQAQTETLHQALQAQGLTPAPDPNLDLRPGMLVKVAPDGKVAVQLRQQEAFPQLRPRSSNFDFLRFTASGTKPGFKQIGLFTCDQGFREDIDSVRSATVSLTAEFVMSKDPSLKVVRSVLGCYGTELLHLGPTPATQQRFVLGFQLTTASR